MSAYQVRLFTDDWFHVFDTVECETEEQAEEYGKTAKGTLRIGEDNKLGIIMMFIVDDCNFW